MLDPEDQSDRDLPRAAGATAPRVPLGQARVARINTSPGGVPKRPVESARVGRLGLEGDAHTDRTVHGGPFRAVCL